MARGWYQRENEGGGMTQTNYWRTMTPARTTRTPPRRCARREHGLEPALLLFARFLFLHPRAPSGRIVAALRAPISEPRVIQYHRASASQVADDGTFKVMSEKLPAGGLPQA